MDKRLLVVDGHGTTKRVPYPVDETPNTINRPEIATFEDSIEWNKEAQLHTQNALSFTQEYGCVHREPSDNKILVVNMSDIHWGHKDTDYDFVAHLFDLIENTPDVYCVFGWNILDAAIPAQFPDGVMWSNMTAQEQVYTFREKLFSLYAKGKLLGAIGDCTCHEGWMTRKTGWMIYRELFENIEVPLLLNGGYLQVGVGMESYRLALFHKIKYWSQFNKTHGGDRAMDRMVDAEIVFTSHLHQAAVGQSNRYNPPFNKHTAVVSSGTCKLFDKFSRGNFGKEGERGGQAIILWGDKHAFQVVYDLDIGCELMG